MQTRTTLLFIALLNPSDEAHEKSLVAADSFIGSIVTTQWVLVEVIDALSDPKDRPSVVRFVRSLSIDPSFKIVPATEELFHRGLKFFDRRKDKSWSLTDCISFVVMQDLGVSDALTGDQHFRQAGFTTLL